MTPWINLNNCLYFLTKPYIINMLTRRSLVVHMFVHKPVIGPSNSFLPIGTQSSHELMRIYRHLHT